MSLLRLVSILKDLFLRAKRQTTNSFIIYDKFSRTYILSPKDCHGDTDVDVKAKRESHLAENNTFFVY